MPSKKINFTISANIKRKKGIRALNAGKVSPFCAVLCTRDNDDLMDAFLNTRTETLIGTSEPNFSDQFQIKIHSETGKRRYNKTCLHVYLFNQERFTNEATYEHVLNISQRDMLDNDTETTRRAKKRNKHPKLLGYSKIDIESKLQSNSSGVITELMKHNKISAKENNTTLTICIEEDERKTNYNIKSGYFLLQLRGLGIKNVESGLLQQGLSDPFYEIWKEHRIRKNMHTSESFFSKDDYHDDDEEEEPITYDQKWSLCYRSKHIDNHVNPTWNPVQIDLAILCGGDLTRRIKIVVYDWEESGAHRLIGAIYTNPFTLLENVCTRGNGDIEKAMKLFKDEEIQGSLVVLKCKVQEKGRRS